MSNASAFPQRFVPATGGTVTVAASNAPWIVAIIEPAGTLATLTTTLPAASYDGQVVTVCSTQIVTTLTLNSAAGSVVGALTALAVSGFADYVWSSSQSKVVSLRLMPRRKTT